MRAASSPRDATMISVLAYAGLRPGEALALQWRDTREQTIFVERAPAGSTGEKAPNVGVLAVSGRPAVLRSFFTERRGSVVPDLALQPYGSGSSASPLTAPEAATASPTWPFRKRRSLCV
jgi:integrase